MSTPVAEPPAAIAPPGRRLPALSGPVLGLGLVLTLFILMIGLKAGVETGLTQGIGKGLEAGVAEVASFVSFRNLQVLVQDGTVPGVLALGMLLIIITGGIDLSVGSVVALVTVVAMQVYRLEYAATKSILTASLLAVPTGVAAGGVCGLVNGLVITRLRITPFVATLGMYGVARGMAFWLSGRTTLAFPRGGRPAWVDALAQVHPSTTLFNPGFWSCVVLAVLVAAMLRYTVFGRYCYAIGSNEAAARLCGVAIDRNKVWVYTVAGLLTGWAGILMFARGGSGDPSCGKELELRVIAAVVIGGASLTGGQGTVGGALLGVAILEVLHNGVNSFNVPVEVEYILMGAIIVANTALSHWRRRQDVKG